MSEQLPRGWRWQTVEELADLIEFGSSSKTSDDSTGVPVLRMGNIQDGNLALESLKYLPRSHADLPKLLLQPGDVLFNRTNSPELVGKCAVYSGIPKVASFASYLLRVRLRGLRPELFVWYINSGAGRAWVRSVVSQQVGQANVNSTKLKAFRVPVPPSEVQDRLSAKLNETLAQSRAARQQLAAVPPLVERFRQSVLAAAFRGDLTRAWREEHTDVEPAEKLLERIRVERSAAATDAQTQGGRTSKGGASQQDNAGPETQAEAHDRTPLPSTWCWARVSDIGAADLGRMRSPDKHAGNNVRPYLRVKNVYENRIDVEDVMEMQFEPEEFEHYRLLPGDILLNEGQSKELVGRPAMFNGELADVAFTNSLIRFRPFGGAPPAFALLLFRHYLRSGRFQSIAQITTNIAHLGATRFRELDVPVPPLAEQLVIADTLTLHLAHADAIEESVATGLNECERLEASLLARAFSGELLS